MRVGEEDGDNSVQEPVGRLKESGASQFKRDVLRQDDGVFRQEHGAGATVTFRPYLIDRRRLIWAEVLLINQCSFSVAATGTEAFIG